MLKAVAETLQEFPELNARLEGDQIVYLDRYDLGVAVQTEQGLVVPVVRGCDGPRSTSSGPRSSGSPSPPEPARSSRRSCAAPPSRSRAPGSSAACSTTPIVNHPEVAILSIGRVAERPVVRDGEIVARPTGNVCVTFDHRVVDGARAAEFGLAVIRRLEHG